MTNRQQSTFFFLIVFLFACGAGLLIYKQYDSYYQEKAAIDLEASASFPERLVKQMTSVPTVLADGRLQVDSPKEGDTVGQTFTVSGYAQDWFEGNIDVKIFDAKNVLLYEGEAIASDNYGHPAPFTSSIILTATSTTPDGKIELNDYSAKDGSLVYQKVVNIKFADYAAIIDTAGWKIYKNDQYGFEFQYPADLFLKVPTNVNNPSYESFESTKAEFFVNYDLIPDGAHPMTNGKINGYAIFVSHNLNPDNLTPKQWMSQNFSDTDNTVFTTEVAGLPALRYDAYSKTGGTLYSGTLVLNNGVMYNIQYFYIDSAEGIMTRYESIYENILSTFKFTK